MFTFTELHPNQLIGCVVAFTDSKGYRVEVEVEQLRYYRANNQARVMVLGNNRRWPRPSDTTVEVLRGRC